MNPVHLIGVPLDLGGGRRGVDMGPSAFRIAGIASALASLGRTVVDRGNIDTPLPETREAADPRQRYVEEIAVVCRHLYQEVRSTLEEGAFPLVLGGDHSLAAGSVAAAASWVRETTRRPLGLIWVDAHGDMNTPETTISGNVHGMPLAALLDRKSTRLNSSHT